MRSARGRLAALLGLLGALGGPTLGPAAAQERAAAATSLTLFAGTTGGLWRSADWGLHWERVTGRSEGVSLAEIGPVHGVVAVGRRVYVAAEAGLLLSDDFGQTWSKLGLERPAQAVLPSRFPQADPTVFAGTEEGLLKSVDGGHKFEPTIVRGTAVTRMEWPGPALVVATGHGVLISMDGGTSFSTGMGLPDGAPTALAVSSFFSRDPVLFAAVGTGGVFRSGDGGRTWAPAGLAERAVNDLVWLGPILFAATDQGLFRSDDGGVKWAPGVGLATRPALRLLFPLAPDSGLEAFLATEGGLTHTGDGGRHWTPSAGPDDRILCLATFPAPSRAGRPKKR